MTKLNAMYRPSTISCFIFLGVFALFASQLGELKGEAMIVPLVCLGIMVSCAAACFLNRNKDETNVTTHTREAVVIAATAVYIAAVIGFGFYIASVLYAVFLFTYISGFCFANCTKGILSAVTIAGSIYLIFEKVLGYYIPPGLLF